MQIGNRQACCVNIRVVGARCFKKRLATLGINLMTRSITIVILHNEWRQTVGSPSICLLIRCSLASDSFMTFCTLIYIIYLSISNSLYRPIVWRQSESRLALRYTNSLRDWHVACVFTVTIRDSIWSDYFSVNNRTRAVFHWMRMMCLCGCYQLPSINRALWTALTWLGIYF